MSPRGSVSRGDSRLRTWRRVVLAGCTLGLLYGCTTTQVVHMGTLPNNIPLVRLMVTEDRRLVGQECQGQDTDRILGCEITRIIPLDSPGKSLRGVTIIRYTDSLPSNMALEVEAHELCHAVASLQAIADPCHQGNDGVLQSALPIQPRLVMR